MVLSRGNAQEEPPHLSTGVYRSFSSTDRSLPFARFSPLNSSHSPLFNGGGGGPPAAPGPQTSCWQKLTFLISCARISRYLTEALSRPPRCTGCTNRQALAPVEYIKMCEELLRPRGCIAGPSRDLTLRDARLNPLVGAAVVAGQLDMDTELDSGKIKELLWCQNFDSDLQASASGESAKTPDRASQQLAWTQAGAEQHVRGTSDCFPLSTMHCSRFAE